MVEIDPDLKPYKLDKMLPRYEYAFQTRVVTNPAMVMGSLGGTGTRMMMTVAGGDIDGPMLKGTVLPGGTEWPHIRPDGVGMVNARYTFQSWDGVYINIMNTGFRRGPPEVMNRLRADSDEIVDPELYYFRTYAVFEAPVGPYDFLTRHVFLGIGERQPKCLFVRYYMVL